MKKKRCKKDVPKQSFSKSLSELFGSHILHLNKEGIQNCKGIHSQAPQASSQQMALQTSFLPLRHLAPSLTTSPSPSSSSSSPQPKLLALKTSFHRPLSLPLLAHKSIAATGKGEKTYSTKMALILEKFQIQRNGDANDVFDIYVVGDEKAPGIVAVQEWWGVDFEIKNHAMTIAQKGYRALIPDLYRGKLGLDAAEAKHLMDGLDWPGAVADIAASAKWLKKNGSPKVGVVGFCMGGALTVASAVRIPEVDAAVVFYGIPPPELADPTQTKAPLQAHFGQNDSMKGFSDVESAKVFEGKLQKSGVPTEVYIYPNVGHAFMNASPEAVERKKLTGFGEHHQETADLAWSRFEAWFGKYLKA